jgi:acyl-CoA synthetase (AMP-forming)/AMP-acid ligase II
VRQSDPVTVLYSSGAMGRAKVVLLTHHNLMACNATLRPRQERRSSSVSLSLPRLWLRPASTHTLVLPPAWKRFGVMRLALTLPALAGHCACVAPPLSNCLELEHWSFAGDMKKLLAHGQFGCPSRSLGAPGR